jgi:hypothetical protein
VSCPSVFTTPITVSISEKNGEKEKKWRERKGGTRGVSKTSNVQCPSTYRAVPQCSAVQGSGEMCGVVWFGMVRQCDVQSIVLH